MKFFTWSTALLVFVAGSYAWAQTPAAPPEKVMGWSKTANLGANLSFSSSQDVVGQTDGTSQTYGLNLKGGFNRLSEQDEWRNNLSVIGATTRTPSVPRYVKSSDELKFDTLYLFPLPSHPSLGPYVKGDASAPMFKGEDVRAQTQTYRVTKRNGDQRTVAASSLRLTDGFKPLTTKEGVGFLWKAVQEEKFKLELRLGLGALQIDAKGQYSVQGPNAASEIMVGELSSVSQAGVEVGVSAKGKIDEKSSYEAGVEAMTPLVNNKPAGDKRDAVGLTNVDGFAKLTSNITSWASFSYDYKLKIQPQLVERAQQIHMLVLNVNYNLF